MKLDLEKINKELENKTALDIIKWAYRTFEHDFIKLSTSFGAEGMVLVHMFANSVDSPKIFTIDTGRLFQSTYEVWQELIDKYGVKIETYYPDADDIAELVSQTGPNLFYKSVENRKKCCYVRKVKPLKKALADAQAWVSGLRRSQTESRENIQIVSFNETHDCYKIAPLVNWSEADVWEYIRNNGVPYDKHHDRGYFTIGCEPCTRPSRPAEGLRAGRWWWETEEQKECGLHIEDGKIIRKKQNPSWTI